MMRYTQLRRAAVCAGSLIGSLIFAATVTLQDPGFEGPSTSGWTRGNGGGTDNFTLLFEYTGSGFVPSQTEGTKKLLFGPSAATGTVTVYQTPLTQLAANVVYTLQVDIGNRSTQPNDGDLTVRVFLTLGNSGVDLFANKVGSYYEATLFTIAEGAWQTAVVSLDTSTVANLNQQLNIVCLAERTTVSGGASPQGAWDNVRLDAIGTLHVDGGAGNDANDGLSWGTALATVTEALSRAGAGDEIWVASGTYTPGTLRTDSFNLVANCPLYGGFQNGDTFAQRDPGANVTILSGEIGAAGAADNSERVVVANGITGAVIDGFTIADANNDSATPDGGGLFSLNADITVQNCVFLDCHANNHGGGMYVDGGSFTISDCAFETNTALRGGGLFIDWEDGAISDCTFTMNSVDGAAQGGGGYAQFGGRIVMTNCDFAGNLCGSGSGSRYGGAGIMAWGQDAELILQDCNFDANVSQRHGGGVLIRHALQNLSLTSEFYSCTFTGNSCLESSPGGGGLGVYGCNAIVDDCVFDGNGNSGSGGGLGYEISPTSGTTSLTITDSVFRNNTATVQGGGGLVMTRAQAMIQRCLFVDNVGKRFGGGIQHSIGSLTMESCALINNSQTSDPVWGGGGLSVRDITGTVTNCTIAGNTAGNEGGGVWVGELDGSASLDLNNCIVYGNTAGTNDNLHLETINVTVTSRFSDIQGSGGSTSWVASFGTDGGDNIDADPLFADLAGDDVHLIAPTPAFDAGSNALQAGPTDLDGNSRLQGLSVDMGAYETEACGDIQETVTQTLCGSVATLHTVSDVLSLLDLLFDGAVPGDLNEKQCLEDLLDQLGL